MHIFLRQISISYLKRPALNLLQILVRKIIAVSKIYSNLT
ncbi:hypothetical protein CSUNSWCD_1933 [Campylobacter showae CSUNSWCD]|uniref:Uncharacterized protein n=1 Tax=Campylobacter showae CSUNSWCD TaxID=1244083 RepID=M5IFU0_9BACT|nr:hypothetical protein CSUNSWCD_1933 [Campylobacter showae CSUNSWCD]